MRKFIATTAAGLALATGTIAAATMTPAFAQDGTTQTQSATPDQGQGNHGNLRHRAAKAIVKDSAATIGIAPKDLLTELKAQKSIAQVATEHGVDPQTVVNKLVTDASAKIDQAVANGKLTADKAAEIKTKLPDRVNTLVNRVFDGSHRPAKTAAK